MFYFKNFNSIYFTHIPRTGGRYVDSILTDNGYYKNHTGNEIVYGCELGHFDRARYNKYYNFISSSFTIVRNPVDRFISASFFVKERIKDLESYELFYKLMETEEIVYFSEDHNLTVKSIGLKKLINNWFLPQNNFIEKNTCIWKFENGLDKNFVNWLNDNLSLNLLYNDNINYKKANYDTVKIEINKQIKSNILKYYEDDVELWESL